MDFKNLSTNWKKLQSSGTLTTPHAVSSSGKQKSKQFQESKQQQPQQNGTLKRKRVGSEIIASRRIDQTPQKRRTKGAMSGEEYANAKNSVAVNGSKTEETTLENGQLVRDRVNEGLAQNVDVDKYIALDCEMVGVGPYPHLESALARVSIVNYNGEQVYDSYVKPKEEVTDWRTHVSGIQPKHMTHARSFEEVQVDIDSLLKGRIVVGHSVRKDFEALLLDHPRVDVRDTARHAPYRALAGGGSPKLKILVSELLGLNIQIGEHSSIEDARSTMLLFRRDKDMFEKEHIKKWGLPVLTKKNDLEPDGRGNSKKPKKKRKKKR